MHRSIAIESAVAYGTSTPRERMRYLGRQLVASGVWPPSRGRGVMPLGPAHAVCLLFAVAFAEKGGDIKALVASFATLELQADPGGPMAGMAGSTLLESLSGLLEPDCRARVRLRLHRHAGGEHAADVTIESGGQSILWPFWRSPHWTGWSRRSWELAPEGFEVLRNLLARDDLEGLELKRA